MKAFHFLFAFLFATAGAIAQAQQDGSTPPAGPDNGPRPGVSLDQAKQHELAMITKRIAHLQQVQQCVSAASTFDALRACEPNRRQGAR